MADAKLIGRYEIVEELGHGAMGSVFKARDPAVGRIVALKTIHSAALSGAEAETYRARFQREARASGALAHPGIVPVFDVGDHEGAPYLVMEFVAGRTLADALKRGERFPLDRVCEIGQQIAEALGYAHRQGVIHRDIKPANILMTSREVYGCERPRITDFGIAKLAASEITVTGQMLGTPSFMPPEQFTGAPIDGRADLFSLGVILYVMATGEQPFPGETMTAVSYKIVYTEPVPPAKLNPAIPARLEAAILKCLAKNPADRYQTGEELAQDLLAIRAGLGSTVMSTTGGLAAVPLADPDATLPPTSMASSYPPVKPQAAAKPQASTVSSGKRRKIPIGAVVAIVAVVLAAAAAGRWFLWPYMHHRSQTAQVQPKPPAPPAPQPAPQTVTPIPAPGFESSTTEPSSPGSSTGDTQPLAKALAPAPTAKPTPSKPSAGKLKSASPPVTSSPVPPVVAATTPPPHPASSTPSPTATAPPAPTPAPSPPAAANAPFNPRSLDPTTNAKLKIEMSHIPDGIPYTVEMNGKLYLRGVTGDSTSLDNLYVPPGTESFSVSMKSGSRQVDSPTVKEDFKAKKRKTLKIQIKGQPTGSPTASDPLGPGTQISISFSTPLL